ncbi:SH3 domain-containing protein C23A1.17-like isoform X2 [Penaeus japonicus]|uniref:SH3 domain-containing protein C23A1.17-like isoform X2 n=1 Tax=Penaeus japonicus TaxID=27405 RepID=UPI001C712AB4|nr:SH3 domain-containing protein C23A1.17-like isoform X2 [Penaeus japonicus]
MASVAVGTTADTSAATSAVTAPNPPVPLPRNLSAQTPDTVQSSDVVRSSTSSSSSAMTSVQASPATLPSPADPPQPPPASSPPPPPPSSSPPPPPPPPVDFCSVASPPPPDLPPPPDFYTLSSSPPPPPPPPSYLFPELSPEDLPPPPPAHLMMDLPPPPPPMYICSYDPPSPEVKSEYDPQLPPEFASAAKQQSFRQAPPPVPPPPRSGPPPRPSPPPPPTPPVRQASKENLAATTHTDTPAVDATAATSEITTSAGSPESSCEASGEESKTRGETSTAYPGKNVTEDSVDGRPASSLVSSSTLTATMLLTPESGLSPLPPHALRVSPVPTSSSLEFTDDITMTPPSSDVTFASNFYDNSKDSTLDMETPEATPQLSETIGSMSSTPVDLTLPLVPDGMDTSTHMSETSQDVLSGTATSDDALSPLPKSTSEEVSQGNEDDDSLSARNDVITERSDLDTLVFPSTANTTTTEMAQMSSPFSTEPPSLFSLPTDSDTISADFDSLAADTLSPTGEFDSLALDADTCSVTTFTTAITTDAYILSSSPGVSDTAYATADSTMASATASPAFTESCTITPVPNDYLTPLSTNPTTTPIPSPIPTETLTSRPSSLSPFLDSKSSTPFLSESSLVSSEGTLSSGSQYPVCPSSLYPSPHSSNFTVPSARTMTSSQHRPEHKVTNTERRLVTSQSSEPHTNSTSTQGSSVMSQVSENEKGDGDKDSQPSIDLVEQGETATGSGEQSCEAEGGQRLEKQDCPDEKESENADGASDAKGCKTQEQSTKEELNEQAIRQEETESRIEEEIKRGGQENSATEEKEGNNCKESLDATSAGGGSVQADSDIKDSGTEVVSDLKLNHEDLGEKGNELNTLWKEQSNDKSEQDFENSKSEEAQGIETKDKEKDDDIQISNDKENIEVKSDENPDMTKDREKDDDIQISDDKENIEVKSDENPDMSTLEEKQTMKDDEKIDQERDVSEAMKEETEKSAEEKEDKAEEISLKLREDSSGDMSDAKEDNARPDCEVKSTTVAQNSEKQTVSSNDLTDKGNSKRMANSSKNGIQTSPVIPTITGSVSEAFQGSERAPSGTPPKSPNSRRRRQPLPSFPHSRSPTPSHGMQLIVPPLSPQSKTAPVSPPHIETNSGSRVTPGRTPSPVSAKSCQDDSSGKPPSPITLSGKSEDALQLLNNTVGNLQNLCADLPTPTSNQQDTLQSSERISLSSSNGSNKIVEDSGDLNAKENSNEKKKNLIENNQSQENHSGTSQHIEQNGRKDADSSHTADVLNNNTKEDVKTQTSVEPTDEKQVESTSPQVSEQPVISSGDKSPESSFVDPLPQSESAQPSAHVESVSQSSTLPSPPCSVKSDSQTNDVPVNVCNVQNATPASVTLPESPTQHAAGTVIETSITADQGESLVHDFGIDERKDENGERVEPECNHDNSIPTVSSDKQVLPQSSHENKLDGQGSLKESRSVSASQTPTNGSHTLLSSSSPLHSILEDVVEPSPVSYAKTPPQPPPRSCVNTPKPGMSAPLPPPRQYMLIPINPPQTSLRRHSPPPAPPRSTSIRKSPPPPPPRSAIHTPAAKSEWIDFPPLPPPPISSLNTPSSPTLKLTPVPEETSSPSTPQPSASSRNSETCSPVTSNNTKATTPSLIECEADSRTSNRAEQTNTQAITISSTCSSSQLDVKTEVCSSEDKPPALPPPPEEEAEEEPPLPPPPPVGSQYSTESSKETPSMPPPPPAQPATEALAVSSSSMLTSNVMSPAPSVPPVPPPVPSSTSSDAKSQYTPPPPPPTFSLPSPKTGFPKSSLMSISPYGKVVINRSDLPLPSPEEEIRKVFVNVKDWGILDEETETLSVYTQLRPSIQQGPQCGLVALSMASQVFPETVDVTDLLKEARRRGFTKHGEMFSSEAMVRLAEGISGMEATIRRDVLCDPRTLLELLMKGDLILVPYDAERNHMPGLRGGHKAHWGIICGCLVQCPTLNVHMGGSSKLDSHVDHLWHFRPRLRKGGPGMSRDGSVTPSGTPLIPGSPRLGHRSLRTPDICNEFKSMESHEREGSSARSVDMESWSICSSRVTTPMLPELPHEEFKLIPLWRQGKGRSLMAAPLEKLCESNDQLLSYPEGITEVEMEYVIGSVQDGLAGQVVVLHKTKTALSDLVGILQEKK